MCCHEDVCCCAPEPLCTQPSFAYLESMLAMVSIAEEVGVAHRKCGCHLDSTLLVTVDNEGLDKEHSVEVIGLDVFRTFPNLGFFQEVC